VMQEMIRAGMNVARLNFSHGEFSRHARVIENLRRAARATGNRITMMADLPGPKIRVGKILNELVELATGDLFTLTSEDVIGSSERVSVTFSRLSRVVKPGDRIYLNDGLIQLEAIEIHENEVICRVIVGGELRSRNGLNLPGIDLGISAFTAYDYDCMKFALEHDVDALSQSFVERGADLQAVREAANELGYNPFIIAKIERLGALEHIDEILDAADGIMIARGDLGVELPIEQITIVQKRLMRMANVRAKPVITATQMLESMTRNKRPTRAEATDVANAILDGTDCVMLSGESAIGSYPVDAVRMLAKIATAVEKDRPFTTEKKLFSAINLKDQVSPSNVIAWSVQTALEYISPAAVFVPTHSGATARNIARFRLPVWVVAVSSQEATCQGLQFSYGVFPLHEAEHPDNWNAFVHKWVCSLNVEGRYVILTEGPSRRHPEANHRMEIIDLDRPV
ncbi:MAG: pyruvate kinase, partial [Nitrospirota bacterium]